MHPFIASIVKRGVCLAGCGLFLGLMTLLGGCGKPLDSTEHVEVTGKVLFKGKPLPGGQVNFVAVKGGFASSGHIDETGNYKIKAPAGEVIITVSNTMLHPRKGASAKGPAVPKDIPHPKQSTAEDQPVKGEWVQIPPRYEDSNTSDLKYTVTPGPQTHDIELSDK
jgi:hypothetical protein